MFSLTNLHGRHWWRHRLFIRRNVDWRGSSNRPFPEVYCCIFLKQATEGRCCFCTNLRTPGCVFSLVPRQYAEHRYVGGRRCMDADMTCCIADYQLHDAIWTTTWLPSRNFQLQPYAANVCEHPIVRNAYVLKNGVLSNDNETVWCCRCRFEPGPPCCWTITEGKFHQVKRRMIAAVGNRATLIMFPRPQDGNRNGTRRMEIYRLSKFRTKSILSIFNYMFIK